MDEPLSKEELKALGEQVEQESVEEWLYWMENPITSEELASLTPLNDEEKVKITQHLDSMDHQSLMASYRKQLFIDLDKPL